MSAYVYKPGSFTAHLSKQSTLQDIQWEVSQSNLHLVATKELLEKRGVQVEEGLRDVSQRIEDMDRTLVQGVVTLHTDFLAIDGSIRDLSAKFDWGLTQLESAIGDVRDTLQDLVRLAKSPEQTWALEQFGIGLDAFKQGLYPESLEHVERAINGFLGHTGYKLEHRFHRLLGLIRRSASEVCDLSKAEKAYLNAARYAGSNNKPDAAFALTAAGYVAYCQGKIDDAIVHTKHALNLADIAEAKYNLGKYFMHRHEIQAGLDCLAEATTADPLYAVRCFDDGDFLAHEQDVRTAISRWRSSLFVRCEAIQQSVTDSVIYVRNCANKAIQAIQSSEVASSAGDRFCAMADISHDISQILEDKGPKHEILLLGKDSPYLAVREAYERRGELLDLVEAYSQRLAYHIEAGQSALKNGLSVRVPDDWGAVIPGLTVWSSQRQASLVNTRAKELDTHLANVNSSLEGRPAIETVFDLGAGYVTPSKKRIPEIIAALNAAANAREGENDQFASLDAGMLRRRATNLADDVAKGGEPFLRSELTKLERAHGLAHPQLIDILQRLSVLMTALGRNDEASAFRNRWVSIQREKYS